MIRIFQEIQQDFPHALRYGSRQGVDMCSPHVVRSIVRALVVIGFTSPAFAQGQPRTEIAGGHQWVWTDGEARPAGWFGEAVVNISRPLAVVGQIDGDHHDVHETLSNAGLTFRLSGHTRIYTFLGGLRVSARPGPRVVPYAQVLFGATHVSIETTTTVSGLEPVAFSMSQTEPVLQAGGGVTFALGRALGLRVGLDHRRVFIAGTSSGAWRVSTGLALRF
jgi:hypothetical protein